MVLRLMSAPSTVDEWTVCFNPMPYIVDWIVTILARMGGIVLETLMRDRLDDFNRSSSTPER